MDSNPHRLSMMCQGQMAVRASPRSPTRRENSRVSSRYITGKLTQPKMAWGRRMANSVSPSTATKGMAR